MLLLFWVFWDIGTGALFAWGIDRILNEKTCWTIIFGGLASMTPDLDFLYCKYWKKMGVDDLLSNHRKWPHIPMVFIPLSTGTLALVLISVKCLLLPESGFRWIAQYLLIFVTVNLGHFVWDTVDESCEGIRWFYPFSNRYAVFHPRVLPRIFLTKKEKKAIWEDFKDVIKARYLRLNFRHLWEASICLVAVVFSLMF